MVRFYKIIGIQIKYLLKNLQIGVDWPNWALIKKTLESARKPRKNHIKWMFTNFYDPANTKLAIYDIFYK